MASPKADLPPVEATRALVDGDGRLAVRVTPGARSEGVEMAGDRLLMRVRARPKDGEANEAVTALAAAALGVPPSRVTVLRGATSREKLLRIGG